MPSPGPNRPSTSGVAGGRLWPIVRGYLGACFAAAWALPIGLLLIDVIRGRRIGAQMSDFGIVVGGLFLVILVSAAPLATAAIVGTESRRARSPLVFCAIGLGIGVVIEIAATLVAPGRPGSGHWTQFVVAGIAGAIGGAIYWRLAVRGMRGPTRSQGRI